jgi:hypothetical protein
LNVSVLIPGFSLRSNVPSCVSVKRRRRASFLSLTASHSHLKELFVSAMAQWMTAGGNGSMDDVTLAQVELLRSQMNLKKKKKK